MTLVALLTLIALSLLAGRISFIRLLRLLMLYFYIFIFKTDYQLECSSMRQKHIELRALQYEFPWV